MRKKKLLLATTALSSAAIIAACGKREAEVEPLIANPKGSFYDAGKAPDPLPLPGNPKGSRYDQGLATPEAGPPPAVVDAGAPKPPDAGKLPVTTPTVRMPANPKGSHYNKPPPPPPPPEKK